VYSWPKPVDEEIPYVGMRMEYCIYYLEQHLK